MLPFAQLSKNRDHLFAQCMLWLKVCHLRQIADTYIPCNRYRALIRLLTAREDIHQGRLTRTIRSDQANTIMRLNLKIEASKDTLSAKRFPKIINTYNWHKHSPVHKK